jgi:hypothetical protein
MRLPLAANFSNTHNLGCDPHSTLIIAALLPTIQDPWIVARLEGSSP